MHAIFCWKGKMVGSGARREFIGGLPPGDAKIRCGSQKWLPSFQTPVLVFDLEKNSVVVLLLKCRYGGEVFLRHFASTDSRALSSDSRFLRVPPAHVALSPAPTRDLAPTSQATSHYFQLPLLSFSWPTRGARVAREYEGRESLSAIQCQN